MSISSAFHSPPWELPLPTRQSSVQVVWDPMKMTVKFICQIQLIKTSLGLWIDFLHQRWKLPNWQAIVAGLSECDDRRL